MNMKDIIRIRLEQEFLPTRLEVKDDSAKHKGHVGSQNGAGHFSLIISSSAFKNTTRLEVHRKIYAVLSEWIPEKIHALSIQWIP